MTVATIIQIGAGASREEQPAPHSTVDDTIQKVVKALERSKKPLNFALGTEVQDKGVVQLTSEWDGVRDDVYLGTTPEFTSFMKTVESFRGEPCNIFHVDLDRSAFGLDGPATANVVEYVQSYFPASRATPEFRRRIEEDFSRFDQIFCKNAKGNGNWVFGWGTEQQEHEDIKGEKAQGFFVIRAWESMDCFEQSVNTDAFKEAIPILLAWNTPFKMWHVERKVQNP